MLSHITHTGRNRRKDYSEQKLLEYYLYILSRQAEKKSADVGFYVCSPKHELHPLQSRCIHAFVYKYWNNKFSDSD